MLIMDNASFHYLDQVKQLCSKAGVKLLYLPPYSPDFNPVEEFFAEPKAYIKKAWSAYEEDPRPRVSCLPSPFGGSFMMSVQNRRALKAISEMQVQ